MINIVTPTTRVENLQTIAKSLAGYRRIRWWVVLDVTAPEISEKIGVPMNVEMKIIKSKENAVAGHLHRNYVIEQLHPHDWFYSVDDDNILHSGFMYELEDGREAVVVAQEWKDGSRRLHANIPRMGVIDTAQFAIRKSLIGNVRFQNVYEGDGLFIEEIYKLHPDKFTFIDKALSYYNYLR